MTTGLEIRSLLDESGVLSVSLKETEVPTPADHEVVVRIEASPINPSDLGVLFGPADISKAETSADGVLTAPRTPGGFASL
jgi:NADPH:quinone reductase-like Zn-dependent oxidoreductase